MLENVEIFISYSNYSVEELFKVLSNNISINKLPFINLISEQMSDDVDFSAICNCVFNDKKIIRIFEAEEIELLKGYFSSLGQTDSMGQILNCKTYKEFFKQKLVILESQEKTKCKNLTAITLGLGIIFSIAVI